MCAFGAIFSLHDISVFRVGKSQDTLRPVYWILQDRRLNALVIAVRGTFSMSDFVSDLSAIQRWHEGHTLHQGILESAQGIYREIMDHVRGAGSQRIVITGHSLGGAIAAVLAWLLRHDGFQNVYAFVYGTPQVVDEALAKKMQSCLVQNDFLEEIAKAAEPPEEKLAKLQEVLEDFALPSSPQTLRRALLSRNAQGINAEPPPMHRFHHSSSPVASEYSDAINDPALLTPMIMHSPGWQLHLQRRSLTGADSKPILWKSSMKDFLIAVSSRGETHERKIEPAFTMWQDHWPQGYLYVLEALAERLATAQGVDDEWEDQLEYAIAFHLIGAHRLESGQWSFDVPGTGSRVTLPFRIPLNSLSGFQVRDHFGKYGVDLYFTEDGLPALLETPAGDIVVRGDKEWQYWKFVWRSTLVTGITLTDHLHFTHFRTGNVMARAVRVAVKGSNPLRRVLSIFTFGTIFVNVQAVHVLCGPNHLLHRATPFSNFVKLSHKVPELLQDITEATPIRAVTEDAVFEKLHPKIKTLPFYADGRLLFAAIKKYTDEMFDLLDICVSRRQM
eukprot:symbB.v1.2.008610.t1/scaffold541.1/size189716/6